MVKSSLPYGTTMRVRRRWKPWLQWLLALAAALVVLGCIGYLSLPLLGSFLIVRDSIHRADAIVVLAGEQPRVEYGKRLFDAGYAHSLVLTKKSMYEKMYEEGVAVEHLLLVTDPGAVASTYDEAVAVRHLVQEQRWQSLVVVTSPYHTRRARMMFRAVLRDTGVQVMIQPVDDHWYTPEAWWYERAGCYNTVGEYVKLGFYLIGVY